MNKTKYIKMFEAFTEEQNADTSNWDLSFLDSLKTLTIKDVKNIGLEKISKDIRKVLEFLKLDYANEPIQVNSKFEFSNVNFERIFRNQNIAKMRIKSIEEIEAKDDDLFVETPMFEIVVNSYLYDLPLNRLLECALHAILHNTKKYVEDSDKPVRPEDWNKTYAILTGTSPDAQLLANAIDRQVNNYAPRGIKPVAGK